MVIPSNNGYRYQVCQIGGFRMLEWLWLRFVYGRLLLNWSWEPDWYDLQKNDVEHWGICDGNRLVGGVRLYRPKKIETTMQYRVATFCSMLESSAKDVLRDNIQHVLEITRLLLFGRVQKERKTRKQVLALLMRRIYTQALLQGRPLGLAVVNPFTKRILARVPAEIAVIGETLLPSKNALERKQYGTKVPHYTLLIVMPSIEEMQHRGGEWWLQEVMELGKADLVRDRYPEDVVMEVRGALKPFFCDPFDNVNKWHILNEVKKQPSQESASLDYSVSTLPRNDVM